MIFVKDYIYIFIYILRRSGARPGLPRGLLRHLRREEPRLRHPRLPLRVKCGRKGKGTEGRRDGGTVGAGDGVRECVRLIGCACLRACVRAFVRSCVLACVRACVRVCVSKSKRRRLGYPSRPPAVPRRRSHCYDRFL